MNRIIPKAIEKKDKEIKERKEQAKKPKNPCSPLVTTKQVFAGLAAAGLISGAIHAGGLMNAGSKHNDTQAALDRYLTVNGYHAANHDYKSKQIRQLIIECNMGLISYEALAEGIKEKNLTELDFDVFAQQYLDREDYKEYLELKANNDKKQDKLHGHANGALACACLTLFMGTGMAVTEGIIDLKKKRAARKAAKEEEKRLRALKLAGMLDEDEDVVGQDEE